MCLECCAGLSDVVGCVLATPVDALLLALALFVFAAWHRDGWLVGYGSMWCEVRDVWCLLSCVIFSSSRFVFLVVHRLDASFRVPLPSLSTYSTLPFHPFPFHPFPFHIFFLLFLSIHFISFLPFHSFYFIFSIHFFPFTFSIHFVFTTFFHIFIT